MARRFAPIGRGLHQDTSSDPSDNALLQYDSATNKWQYTTAPVIEGQLTANSNFRIVDAGGTDYMNMVHNGANLVTTFVNTSLWDMDLAGTNGASFGDGGAAKFWVNFQDSRVDVRDGWPLRIYDSTDTDYASLVHNGTDFLLDFANTTWFRIGNSTPPSSGTLFRGGQDVRVYDAGDNDYIGFSHDGTDATIHCHQTGELKLTGADFLNASDLRVTTSNLRSDEVGLKGAPIQAKTANYTLALSDAGQTIRCLGAGITITIPPNSSVAFPTGTIIWFMNIDGTNNVTIAEGSGVGIIGQGTSVAGSMTLTPRTLIAMIKYTTDGWCYIGTP